MAVGLNKMQKDFADFYLAQRKKRQGEAAIRAGYSVKSADSQASQLLKNPKIIKYIEEQQRAKVQELKEEFIYDALEARKVMYKILTDPNAEDKDKITIARDFLDRAGFKPTDKVENTTTITTNPLKDLDTDEIKKIISDLK